VRRKVAPSLLVNALEVGMAQQAQARGKFRPLAET